MKAGRSGDAAPARRHSLRTLQQTGRSPAPPPARQTTCLYFDMRLSTLAGSTIRDTVRSVLGPGARVRLFGSRTNDSARGGDIDLLVESDTAIEQPALLAARIGALLQLALGDQRIDVVISAPNLPDQAIHKIARTTGIAL